MAARRPNTDVKRSYDDSVEKINSLPSAADQKYIFTEINDRTETLKDHADLLDNAELKWYAGFTLSHTWVVAEDGSKKPYHAHADATIAQIAATVPGSNGSVWVASTGADTDYVAIYNTAKS